MCVYVCVCVCVCIYIIYIHIYIYIYIYKIFVYCLLTVFSLFTNDASWPPCRPTMVQRHRLLCVEFYCVVYNFVQFCNYETIH